MKQDQVLHQESRNFKTHKKIPMKEMKMVKTVDKVMVSDKTYPFKVDASMLNLSLSHHLFKQMSKRCQTGDRRSSKIINARNKQSGSRNIQDLEPSSRKLGNALKELGLRKKQPVLIMLHNNIDFLCPVFASWFLGGYTSVISPNLTPANLAKQLAAIPIRFIFCADYSLETVKEGIKVFMDGKENMAEKFHIIVVDSTDPISKRINFYQDEHDYFKVHSLSDIIKTVKPLRDDQCAKDFSCSDRSIVFWSSGTTGDPKGIIMDFSYMVRLITFEENFFECPDRDETALMNLANMFHAGGFLFTLINGIRNCHNLVIFSHTTVDGTISPKEMFQACHDYRPQLLLLGTHQASQLAQSKVSPDLDLSSVMYLVPIGSQVPESLPQELRFNFPNFRRLILLYGMTETMIITVSYDPNNLGRIAPGSKVRIVDINKSKDGKWIHLEQNQIGEIQASTQYMMRGYLDKEANTAFWTSDGYGRTGDLGYYDGNGVLHFTGRFKDLIKYQGNHLYPAEIEAIIHKHPGVSEVVVFGLPDPQVQEYVAALVVPKNGHDLCEDDITDLVENSGVENYKWLRGGVRFVDSLPKNATGKVMRSELPDLFYES